jgi:hypothetical protein
MIPRTNNAAHRYIILIVEILSSAMKKRILLLSSFSDKEKISYV